MTSAPREPSGNKWGTVDVKVSSLKSRLVYRAVNIRRTRCARDSCNPLTFHTFTLQIQIKLAPVPSTFSITFVYWTKFISVLVFSVWMTVAWQGSVQPVSGVSAMFILDDRCNLPLYQLTGQSISHYSFQTISSWLGFPRCSNKFRCNLFPAM